jgi:hypothetical protein
VVRAARRTAITGLFAAAALFLGALRPGAEVVSTVTITGYTSLLYSGRPEDPVEAAALAKASLNLDSVGNENVKGYFQLDTWIADSTDFDIPRAYLKVRLPWFRLTLGKTRLSWGDGFVFNAGDVLFGSLGAISGDPSGETLRDETGWLAAAYLPVGPFSFLEAVVAPYDLTPSDETSETDPGSPGDPISLDELSGGLRGAFKFGRTTLEAGYFASGPDGEHRPYVSLHGHLLLDWNLSASMAVPMVRPPWGQWDQWLAISAGAFGLVNLGAGGSLSFRLEAAVRPGAAWKEETGVAAAAGEEDAPVYGLLLFPEISFSPSDTVSLQLRCFISPVDLSALSVASVRWNIYQGLDIFSHLSLMTGDGNDLYGTARSGGVGWTSGLEFIY